VKGLLVLHVNIVNFVNVFGAHDRKGVQLATLTASFDFAGTAACGASTGPLAPRAGYVGCELPERLVRERFPFSMTAPTVAFSRSVTIRACMRGHTKRSNVLDDSGLVPPNSQGEPDGVRTA
jgi:hypothetical protein